MKKENKGLGLPSVNTIGSLLEREGLVSFGERAYNQNSDNCVDVASRVASIFGYNSLSRNKLQEEIYQNRSDSLWGTNSSIVSPACFVIRTPDSFGNSHIAFEFMGKEYNYGVATEDGFPVEMRIPLQRVSINQNL